MNSKILPKLLFETFATDLLRAGLQRTQKQLLFVVRSCSLYNRALKLRKYCTAQRCRGSPSQKMRWLNVVCGLKSTLSKWQMRWPSTSYDSVEVWERVSSFRSICLEALSHLAKQTSKNSIKQANIDACWHASRGLRRVGETKLSLKFLQKYGEAIKNSDKEKEWKYAKAKLKGKLSVTNDAEDLESILSTIRNREDLEKSFVIAPHMADVKNIEGSICEKLCMFTKDKNRVENLAHETISCYSAAESCAEAENNVKLSSKASLNLARFVTSFSFDSKIL